MKEEREHKLLKYSFSSDLQVIHELDEIAGTTGMDVYPKEVIIQFLRSKEWVIEEIEAVEDVEEAEQPKSPSLEPKPSHIIFPSSSSDSGNEATPGHEPPAAGGARDVTVEKGVDKEDPDDVDKDDSKDDDMSSRAFRSDYVGRGNVQVVRSARKLAGLSSAFPRSDPLLREFADFLAASGASAKDTDNKVNSNSCSSLYNSKKLII